MPVPLMVGLAVQHRRGRSQCDPANSSLRYVAQRSWWVASVGSGCGGSHCNRCDGQSRAPRCRLPAVATSNYLDSRFRGNDEKWQHNLAKSRRAQTCPNTVWAVIAGDGIGPEVIAEGRKVLDAVAIQSDGLFFRVTEFPWGSDYYRETGRMMPEDGLERLSDYDAVLFGAVGDPNIPDHVTLQGLLLPMRRAFDQAICIRPAVLYPGVESPIAGKSAGDVDMVIFRENTEGEYAPVGGRLYPGTPHETVIQSGVFTRRGTERIIRAAFEYSVRRGGKNKVTSVTKSNAQAFSMVFWDEVFDEVAARLPAGGDRIPAGGPRGHGPGALARRL